MTSRNLRIPLTICLTLSLSQALAGCRSSPDAGVAHEQAPAAAPLASAASPTTTEAPSEQRLRQVIRKAELSFDVASPADALGRATRIVERHGGFVASSNSTAANEGTDTPESVVLTLRVPSEHFSDALRELRTLSRGAGVEHIGSEDVSEECVDLDARLKTQRALEQQFLEILKRADKVEDALRVEREIATVRTEIERMEGRRRWLAREVALSTISLTLSQEKPLVSSSWQDFRNAARHAYADSIDNASALVTFSLRAFGALFPVMLILGLPTWLAFRQLGRFRKRRAALLAAASQ